jgi:signal transduction histidine kinase
MASLSALIDDLVRGWQPDQHDARLPELDLARLRFRDRRVEAAYREDKRPGYVAQLRIGLLVGVVLYALYGPLDAHLAGAQVGPIWLVRYAIGVPLVLACVALSWTAFFNRNPQLLMTLTMQIVGASVIAQMVLLPTPGTSYYFAGLITALVFACCVLRPHPAWASLNCALFVVGYVVFATFFRAVDQAWLLNNLAFLLADSIVAIFASYLFELRLRQIYARDRVLEEQLERTEDLRQKAERANMLKSRFVATASHELRTPLNAIVGFAEILANERFGPLGNADYRDYAATIHDSGARLMSTVNDLLDVSKAQANTLELAREHLDLNAVLRRAVTEVRPQADDKGLAVRLTETKDALVVEADPSLLRRASANLLTNAVKFTDAGGVDVIARRDDDGRACIDVIDTGPGIPEAEQTQIFDSFVHGDSAYRRRSEGAGLGLALVQQIARMHGGSVAVASTPGTGTRFTLVLPAAPDATAADPAAAA